ncbi:replication initiation protein [Clostridium sp. Marseille-Q2269]|uniref:replication initiation protein n=1 Tax=Clostridium sp. Marseille-Q2269 TaxID=2942205 RepID=UPI002074A904|nr:replication initiation protein [Clostridium sp. Marseille-Q2269]
MIVKKLKGNLLIVKLKNWVYQSNRLIEASYTLTVIEQKLIRLLASMIKKDDTDFKEYKFKTKDLIKILI